MSKSTVRLAALLVFSSVGCQPAVEASDHYRSTLEHTGYFPDEKLSPDPQIVKKYGLVNVGIHTASKSSPIVESGIIYVGADSGHLYAIRESDMTVKWSFRVRPTAKFGIHGTPAIDQNHIYIGGYDGWLYALDKASGQLRWQSELGDYIGSSPMIWGDRIYIGVETSKPGGYLSCVDKDSGKELFRSTDFGDHTHGTPTIHPETKTAFLGANSKKFYAVDTDSGAIRWEYTTGGDIKSTAALHDGKVLFTSWDGYLYNLTRDSGELVWRFKTAGKSMSSPAIDTDDRRVYFGSHDFKLYAVDLDSGERIWSYRTGKRIISSPTLVSNATGEGKIVVFGSGDTFVYGLNAENGVLLFKIKTQGKLSCVPTVKNGTLYVSGDDGFLYVIR